MPGALKGLILTATYFSPNVFAYGRGGSCSSTICDTTGFFVIAGITALILLSAAKDIKEKDWIKGITQNKVLTPLVIVVCGFISVIWVIAQIYKTDKEVAILLCSGIAIWLFYQVSKNDSDEKNPNEPLVSATTWQEGLHVFLSSLYFTALQQKR